MIDGLKSPFLHFLQDALPTAYLASPMLKGHSNKEVRLTESSEIDVVFSNKL